MYNGPMNQLNPYAGRFMGRAGAIGTPLRGGLQRGLLFLHLEPFCLAVILASALASHSANMPAENKRQRGPGRRGGGGPSREATIIRLLSAHDSALERLKAGLTVMLFVPRLLSDAIEKAAQEWKSKAEAGKPHPDGCSCCTARLKALLSGIDAALRSTPPLLHAPEDTKAGLVQLVETINAGHADIIVAEITLRLAQSRAAAQSPYEIVLCSSTEGNLLRTCLSKITQPGAPPQNTKEQVEKSWELRAYRPNRKGALLRALQGE